MTMRQPFPEAQKESRGIGAAPDFPGSSGDRERGKFRPSATPGLTKVAVSGDDGKSIVLSTDQLLADLCQTNRAILWALAALADGASFTVDEALAEVR